MPELSVDAKNAAEDIFLKIEGGFKNKSSPYQDGFKSSVLYLCKLFKYRQSVAADVKETIADLKSVEWAWKTQGNPAELYNGFAVACEVFVPLLRKHVKLGPDFFSYLFNELVGLSEKWVTAREEARKKAPEKK